MSCLDKVPPKFTKTTIKGIERSHPWVVLLFKAAMRVSSSEQEHFQMNTPFCQKEYKWMDGWMKG